MVEAMAAGVPIEPLARYFEYWLLRLQGVYQPTARLSAEAQAFLEAARDVQPVRAGGRAGVARRRCASSRRRIAR